MLNTPYFVQGLAKFYRERKRRLSAAEFYAAFSQREILMKGIIVRFPSTCPGYSEQVDKLLENVAFVTAVPAIDSSPLRVAYTDNYVLYFTTTPNVVPGYDEGDDPFVNSPQTNSIEAVSTSNRAYINIPEDYANVTDSVSYNDIGEAFSTSLTRLVADNTV